MSTIWRTTVPPGSVALMSRLTLFWTSSVQGSWLFRANPTLLEMSTIALQMEMRGIPWCNGLKYKRGRTVLNMQIESVRSPQSLREKIRTQVGSTLRPPTLCVRFKCLFVARGKFCQWTVDFVRQWEYSTSTSTVCMGNHSSRSESIGQRGAPGNRLTVTWRVRHLDLLNLESGYGGGGTFQHTLHEYHRIVDGDEGNTVM